MRQSTENIHSFLSFYLSKLPMRQSTRFIPLRRMFNFSKLPMRQSTTVPNASTITCIF